MLLPESIDRRRFLTTAALGTAAAWSIPALAAGADWTDTEKANVKVVNAMCSAWSAPLDFDRIGSFLADDCTFRSSETAMPITGRQAIIDSLRKMLGSPQKAQFEIVQTFARGPIVMNERFDRFTMPQRNINWNGVGVFFLRNGLIAEWNDFAIKMG